MTDAVYFARLVRASADIARAANVPNRRKLRQAQRRFNTALRAISLEGYVAFCNRDAEGFELAGAEHWRAQGVATAWALGRLLDAEHQRNLEKDARYASYEEDGEDPADYDDGQPDEAQEWHDFDPDC